ncbi:MAG: hypothetical protein IPJ56_18220 [Gemmatimonadetes bacterium]|nr:hypothetical protein [Gemmatimonadota bacterium]
MRYRDGFDKARMMEAGKVQEVPVDFARDVVVPGPGHRLRVQVSSSNFPRFDRNLNTGGRNYDETTWRVARNAVHHSGRRRRVSSSRCCALTAATTAVAESAIPNDDAGPARAGPRSWPPHRSDRSDRSMRRSGMNQIRATAT